MVDTKTIQNIEIDGMSMRDYPRFCDSFVCYAEHSDGFPLSDEELDELNDTGFASEYILDNQLYVDD
jgi:hypothetical protein